MSDADEECLQDVLEEILLKIGLTEKEFQSSLNFHMDDPSKTNQIKETQEDASIDKGEGKTKNGSEQKLTMNKKEAIAASKKM